MREEDVLLPSYRDTSETLAQKSIAAGFIGEQVDGYDVVAMHAEANAAIDDAARNGQGPRFIEAVTYRLGDHTTADDAARYRPPEEVQARFSGPVQNFSFYIPLGSQAPQAAGVAYAFKLCKEPRVAVCLFGDSATSKGDVWEAMNFTGVHRLPVVSVVTNNQ